VSVALPEVNSLVRVVLAETDERPSRVESDDDGLLALAAPWHAAALAPGPGEPLAVRWSTLRGLCEVTATLVSVDRENAVALWRVQTEGEIRVLQRRRFARADATAPVMIAPLLADTDCHAQPEAVMATLTNLSEGGARVRVDGVATLEKAGLTPDGEVELRMSLGAVIVRVVGIVIRITPDVPRTARDAAEVVVSFDAPDNAADLIRRFVMHQQVLARRAARD
jgi:c-di-GMP-binding flagellar brake protein YcgR